MLYVTAEGFSDYELIDTGVGERLERWGSVVLRRPDPQIIWQRHEPNALWDKATAQFTGDESDARWKIFSPIPEPWILQYKASKYKAKLTNLKSTTGTAKNKLATSIYHKAFRTLKIPPLKFLTESKKPPIKIKTNPRSCFSTNLSPKNKYDIASTKIGII